MGSIALNLFVVLLIALIAWHGIYEYLHQPPPPVQVKEPVLADVLNKFHWPAKTLMKAGYRPEAFEFSLSLNQSEVGVYVSKEMYDTTEIGEKVLVTYEYYPASGRQRILSINKPK